MFDHALVISQYVPLFRRLVAFLFCTGLLVLILLYLETCLRLHSPRKIVMMWLAYGDGSGYTKPTKT